MSEIIGGALFFSIVFGLSAFVFVTILLFFEYLHKENESEDCDEYMFQGK